MNALSFLLQDGPTKWADHGGVKFSSEPDGGCKGFVDVHYIEGWSFRLFCNGNVEFWVPRDVIE